MLLTRSRKATLGFISMALLGLCALSISPPLSRADYSPTGGDVGKVVDEKDIAARSDFSPTREYRCDLSLHEAIPAFFSGRPTWDANKALVHETFQGYARHSSGALLTYDISRKGNRLEQIVVEGKFSTADGGKLSLQGWHQVFVFGNGYEKDERWGNPIYLRGEDGGVLDLGEYKLVAKCGILENQGNGIR